MNHYQAIRLKALLAVMRPDREYLLRKIIRWYSKTFHTPIQDVEELPMDEVLQAFYEERYQDMTDEERDIEREELLLSDEERYKRMINDEVEAAERFDFAKFIAEEERQKQEQQAKLEAQKKTEQNLAATQPKPLLAQETGEADLPRAPIADIPEGITMTFVDEAELEAELDGFGLMTQPSKP